MKPHILINFLEFDVKVFSMAIRVLDNIDISVVINTL